MHLTAPEEWFDGRRATSLPLLAVTSQEEELHMYEKPELTKHEDLTQITFSSH